MPTIGAAFAAIDTVEISLTILRNDRRIPSNVRIYRAILYTPV